MRALMGLVVGGAMALWGCVPEGSCLSNSDCPEGEACLSNACRAPRGEQRDDGQQSARAAPNRDERIGAAETAQELDASGLLAHVRGTIGPVTGLDHDSSDVSVTRFDETLEVRVELNPETTGLPYAVAVLDFWEPIDRLDDGVHPIGMTVGGLGCSGDRSTSEWFDQPISSGEVTLTTASDGSRDVRLVAVQEGAGQFEMTTRLPAVMR